MVKNRHTYFIVQESGKLYTEGGGGGGGEKRERERERGFLFVCLQDAKCLINMKVHLKERSPVQLGILPH